MRITRIYQPGPYVIGRDLALSSTASQHVGVVLRMRVGERLTIFSGEDVEAPVTISAIDRKLVYVNVDDVYIVSRESPLAIHLVQGISKGERMDFVVQKAVELGVHSISPIVSAHCVVRLNSQQIAKKMQHWQAISLAACEQSGRNRIPVIHPVSTFSEQISSGMHAHSVFLDPHARGNFQQIHCADMRISVWIGPEGGFHPDERQAAITAGHTLVSLGPRVLRTETAAIAAISVLQVLHGDL